MFSTNRRMKDSCPLEFEVDLKKKKRWEEKAKCNKIRALRM